MMWFYKFFSLYSGFHSTSPSTSNLSAHHQHAHKTWLSLSSPALTKAHAQWAKYAQMSQHTHWLITHSSQKTCSCLPAASQRVVPPSTYPPTPTIYLYLLSSQPHTHRTTTPSSAPPITSFHPHNHSLYSPWTSPKKQSLQKEVFWDQMGQWEVTYFSWIWCTPELLPASVLPANDNLTFEMMISLLFLHQWD